MTSTTSKVSNGYNDDAKREMKLPAEVDAFEKAFIEIEDDFKRSVASGKSGDDYKNKMQVIFSDIFKTIETFLRNFPLHFQRYWRINQNNLREKSTSCWKA